MSLVSLLLILPPADMLKVCLIIQPFPPEFTNASSTLTYFTGIYTNARRYLPLPYRFHGPSEETNSATAQM